MPKGYHQLTRDQRCQLYALKKRGDSKAEIAKELGVHRSSIYRELSRNAGKKGYRYQQADGKAIERRMRASARKPKMTTSMIAEIDSKLTLQWSPVQISGWLKKQPSSQDVSHETIYCHIWEDKRKGGFLYKNLRHSGKKYNKRSKGAAGRGCIPYRVDIAERPAEVDDKLRLGDWELDTIIGAGGSGAIVSMVERRSKLTRLRKVETKTAEEVKEAIIEELSPIKGHVLTLTADNGKEFAAHLAIAGSLNGNFYFATPYHSWERGLNEHTNGLVRQYYPKSTRFDDITNKDLKEVEDLLNNRPRKVLDFASPIEVFNRLSRESASVALQS